MAYSILVVDDAEMNRQIVTDVLRNKLENVQFFHAANGEEAFEVLEKVHVDLIMLDLVMPTMDGYQVMQRLEQESALSGIPVIVSSAITEISSIEATLKMGARDYFTKPLSVEEMEVVLPLKVKNALLLHEQQQTIEALNREIQVELKNAHDFQSIMLPRSRDFKSVDLHIKYHPSMGIGGDCFDCFESEGKLWFIIADVTGHGIAAGMASSMVKVLFRCSAWSDDVTPAQVLERVNARIYEIFDFGNAFNYLVFTAFAGCIEDGVLTYANAGQPYPLVYHTSENKFEVIEEGGVPVGAFEGVKYDDYRKSLRDGDALFLYTDGLFSCGRKTDFVNWKLVHQFAHERRTEIEDDPDLFLDELFWYFHLVHKKDSPDGEGDYTDDVAMMLLKMKPGWGVPENEQHEVRMD